MADSLEVIIAKAMVEIIEDERRDGTFAFSEFHTDWEFENRIELRTRGSGIPEDWQLKEGDNRIHVRAMIPQKPDRTERYARSDSRLSWLTHIDIDVRQRLGTSKQQSDQTIDLLINTHHHGDHSGGNIAFKGITKMLLAHENSRKNQMREAKERDEEDSQLYPDTTYNKEWSEKVGDEIMTLRYFGPSHTDGDSIIHFENANIAHMGDLIFNRRFPYIDRSAGASIENWILFKH